MKIMFSLLVWVGIFLLGGWAAVGWVMLGAMFYKLL